MANTQTWKNIGAVQARRRAAGWRILGIELTALAFILPALLMYTALYIVPTLQLGRLSLFRWDGIAEPRFIGLDNYVRLAQDGDFWLGLRNNFLWMIAAMIIPVTIGLLLAILLARSPMRGRVLFRTIYFMPQVFSSVIVAIIWGWIYNPSFGALNALLDAVGLGALKSANGFLGDRALALGALFIAWSWVHYGFAMVVFLAALSSIDEVYFDAAKVDGANRWQQFRHVLLPFIRGSVTTVMLVTAISAFQVFDLVFILTDGGPGRSTMVTTLHMINNAFYFQKVGYGAAIATVFGVILLVLSLVFLKVRSAFQESP